MHCLSALVGREHGRRGHLYVCRRAIRTLPLLVACLLPWSAQAEPPATPPPSAAFYAGLPLIFEANAGQIKCRILAEAANGPTTPEADKIIASRPEIFVLPDILCNAGGVVVSYFEWVQDLQSFFWGETEITDKLFRILENAFTQILGVSRKQKIPMRLAALSLGVKRVQEAKRVRGLFP